MIKVVMTTLKFGKLMRKNLGGIFVFELFYKALGLIIALPIFCFGMSFLMTATGYRFLTLENLTGFIFHPITIIAIILLIILTLFYVAFEAIALILLFDQSRKREKTSLIAVLKETFSKFKRIFRLKNLLLPVVTFFSGVFLLADVVVGVILVSKIPEFIKDFVFQRVLLIILIIAVLLLAFYVFMRLIYATSYFVLENLSLKEACKKSFKLSKKHTFRDIFTVILQKIIALAAVGLLILILIPIPAVNLSGVGYILTFTGLTILVVIAAIFSVIFHYGTVSYLYYKRKNQVAIKASERALKGKTSTISRVLVGSFSIILIGGAIFGIFATKSNKFSFAADKKYHPEITGHRGAAADYPENTMAAFRGAKELGADWVELDVQQSKDGQIFVMHDSDFVRTVGLGKKPWELNYDEIAKLDAGSFFHFRFAKEKPPLLAEVLEVAKENNLRLNIELKPTGHEVDFEKKMVDLINQYDCAGRVVVASLNYQVLENVKKYDSNIATVYVMVVAQGDFAGLPYADGFSIEYSNITPNLVENIHKEGKEVSVWLLNSDRAIYWAAKAGADNLITNKISFAREVVEKMNESDNFYLEYLCFLGIIF